MGKAPTEPPLNLRLLGGVDLRRADGTRLFSLLALPKRLALLAYVAMEAPGGFVSRERVLAVLWPDSDTTRARQSLRNSLHRIRQTAGADVLINRGSTDLGVNPTRLFVDAVALRAAVAGGEFQQAVDLYGGPFLSGFHLDKAPEFEEWAGRTRAILEVDVLRALREAARMHEGSGQIEAARRLLRRAQEIAPADEEILRRRLLLLESQGNRAAAVAEGEDWIDRLRATLEIEPSEATLRLVHDLRSGARAGVGSAAAPPAPLDVPAARTPRALATATARPGARGVRSWARSAPARWLAVAAVTALGVLAWFLLSKPPPMAPRTVGVIVEPFEAASAAGGRKAGLAVGALTARYLQPETGGLVLPAAGIAAAASFDGRNRWLISGRIRAVHGRLVADVSLATTADPGRVVGRASAAAQSGDLEALAIQLANELAGPGALDLPARGPVPRFTQAPGAIVPFFQGEILAREGEVQEAVDAYQRAIALDSTFAMAYYRLSVSERLLGRTAEAAAASDKAIRLSAGLTDGEQKLVDAWRAYRSARVQEALPRYTQLAASRGPDPTVWLRLAELRFHWGAELGVPWDSAAAAFRVLLGLVPDDANAMQHLIRIMGPSAEPKTLARVVQRLYQARASDDMKKEAAAIAALNQRRSPDASVAQWLADARNMVAARRLEQLAASAPVPYDLAPFIRSLPPTNDPFRSILRRLLLVQLAASAGRMREAYAELDTVHALNPYRALEYRCFLALSSPIAPSLDRLRALRRRLRAVPLRPGSPISIFTATQTRIDPLRALVLDAMLTRRLGEPVDSTKVVAPGRALSHFFDPTYLGYLRADRASRAGDAAHVLVALGPGAPEWNSLPDPFSYLIATSKWERIQSLVALRRDDDALRWLETIPDVGGYDLLYIAPASLLRGRILERLGRTTEAAAAYRRAAELWAHADPAFDSLVDEARRGAARTGATSAR